MDRVLNWRRDLPDHRDLYLKVSRLRMLPQYVDLRSKCSTVEDQGDIGSCSAQAFVANLEYLDRVADDKYVDLSRLFVYYNTREDKGEDTGAYLRDGIKALARYGACDETIWPYATERYAVKPPDLAYRDGLKRRITAYQRIEGLKGIRQSLADGFPVVFGFSVYGSFNTVGRDGMMPMPDPDDRLEGGHAVLAVGYDDKARRLIVRNSWGASWGDNGYFYMPYDYITDDLTADFWTITRVPHPVGDIDFGGEDIKWYIPITGIWALIKKLFGKGD